MKTDMNRYAIIFFVALSMISCGISMIVNAFVW